MRLTSRTAQGELSLNWLWLPTVIGHNVLLVKQLDAAMGDKFYGRELNEELLDEMDSFLKDRIVEMFPSSTGLREYLDALNGVSV